MESPVNEAHIKRISGELNINPKQVVATAALLAEGGTVPFIARYRKEATGSLDEVAITAIRQRLSQLAELDERRAAILKSLVERELLTDELATAIGAAETMAVLEDIYLPYRPKRRTRATIAKEKGLEPLALLILEQRDDVVPVEAASAFVDEEKGVASADEALAGARDIVAEMINEDAEIRKDLRALFMNEGIIQSKVVKGKDAEGAKFRDYFDWQESVKKAAGHRMLAMIRGEKEGVLRLSIQPSEDLAMAIIRKRYVKGENPCAQQVTVATDDAYSRLLSWSMETEARMAVKERADLEAIGVFSANLRELLMAPPLGGKSVLAIDPGFRTGCKVVCLDPQGKLLFSTAIFPTQSDARVVEAKNVLLALCDKYKIEAIAIGNGTASRETEAFVRALPLPKSISIILVNESGASIYSASDIAREEFPDHDVTVRGSVSIGRRLMDPLAELVKIDPKSIGVGQYQHDVNQMQLKEALDDVVMSCVNAVGVEVNTASRSLLAYVSGLGPSLAKAIVAYRDASGAFANRDDIKKVPRLGPKAFEQAAGFLRVRGSKHPLDRSAVHPESYAIVERMAKDLGCSVADLMQEKSLRDRIELSRYVSDTVGLPTLNDIMAELAKPGRDPRAQFEEYHFSEEVHAIEDLKPGMKLNGIVTNVTNFGAFVDVGVHQDGLVHISELSDHFVKNPMDVVKVQQKVKVKVMSVDLQRRRIALSMRSDAVPEGAQAKGDLQHGKGPRKMVKPPEKAKSAMALALEKALK
jgi:uncharacterized protein